MPTTVELVDHYLETDPALVDVLMRDMVSLRRTARKLIAKNGWDTTEEAVVSALRRFKEEPLDRSTWNAKGLLRQVGIEAKDMLALVTIPRTPEIQEAAFEAWMRESGTGPLGVLPGKTKRRLLIEERYVGDISEAVGPLSTIEVTAPVAMLRLILPQTDDAAALMSVVLAALSHHGIQVLELVSLQPEWTIILSDDQLLEAHRVICALTSDDPTEHLGSVEFPS